MADKWCIYCGGVPVDPAHLIPRSLVGSKEMGDRTEAVIPLCRKHHDAYERRRELDLSPYLEPYWRDAQAWAVEAVGWFRAMKYFTCQDWTTVD